MIRNTAFLILSLYAAVSSGNNDQATAAAAADGDERKCIVDVVEAFKEGLKAPIEEHLPEIKRQLEALHTAAMDRDSIDFHADLRTLSDLVNAHAWKPQTSDNNLTDKLTAIRDGAHDIKNALAICLLQTKQLLIISNVEEAKVIRTAIAGNLQLSLDILEEALNPNAIKPRKVSLTELFKKIENSLLALPTKFEVSFVAPPTGYSLTVSPVSIQRIVQNLVYNCIEAFESMETMPNPARIKLQIKIAKHPQHDHGGMYAVFVVEDNGPGMETDRSVIAPETPRMQANGINERGIGTQAIGVMLDANGGTLDYDSTPGRGTRVNLYFPVIAPNPALAAVKVEPNSILWAEDVKDLLDLQLMMSKMSRIPAAGVGKSKLLWDVVEAHTANIRCVLLDQSLGDGISLEMNVAKLRELGYTGPIIMVSGDGHASDAPPEGVAARIVKPTVFEDIMKKVDEVAPLPKAP